MSIQQYISIYSHLEKNKFQLKSNIEDFLIDRCIKIKCPEKHLNTLSYTKYKRRKLTALCQTCSQNRFNKMKIYLVFRYFNVLTESSVFHDTGRMTVQCKLLHTTVLTFPIFMCKIEFDMKLCDQCS